MTLDEHLDESTKSIRCMVLTVSNVSAYEDDQNGQLIRSMLEKEGHSVTEYQMVGYDYSHIQHWIKIAAIRADIDAILITGGTGIGLNDTTHEAVRDSLDKEMPGFGELFRHLSFAEEVGTAAILSRAVAGVRDGKAIFSMPGATGAVKLAMERIIMPEISQVVREILLDQARVTSTSL
ncbi:molybdenum cofactor biosynthesis protein B [Halalkalibacter sp. APA_J-10(15)]|uniref:MogA/MoaB family molybdenum cofactor biosynthesis protein n=1 Tax=unclassified Halalkalibacter TaxID=2893063 RepID=UPI001FF1BBAA|nr:molybdenum cofactor biosynthesis protein B [Halalkalibacter sp. APA_J-10(15)]MCK0473530.1 molybdenum cofactor biosynthesis protein MoaB [Halalkalibacter sp. APA_J-10(15)]